MARIGIVSVPLPGHMGPHLDLGRALAARGHSVHVYQLPYWEDAISRAGLSYVALPNADAQLDRFFRELSGLSGLDALRKTIAGAMAYSSFLGEALGPLLRSETPDLLLVDQSDLVGHAHAQASGVPFVTVCPALPIHREASIPPPVVPWEFDASWKGRLRNKVGYAAWDVLLWPLRRRINAIRRRLGLPSISVSEECFSPLVQIAPIVPELDFPRTALPHVFRYTGPFFLGREDMRMRAISDGPWKARFPKGRRLVYASLGTLTNDCAPLYRAVARACAEGGHSLVIGLGGNARAAAALGDLPGDTVVLERAPQREILAEADAFVSHGGLNSVIESCVAGVPLVVVPFANDQPALAARLVRTGACRVIPLSRVTVHGLADALSGVLHEPSHAIAATHLGDALRASGGVDSAADVVEQVLMSQELLGGKATASTPSFDSELDSDILL